MTTVGSLFTGYGGLDMGVMTALDSSARIAWTSDVEPGPYAEAIARWEKVTGRAAPLPQHPHADQAENHNSQHGSSNGSWACPTATSPAQT